MTLSSPGYSKEIIGISMSIVQKLLRFWKSENEKVSLVRDVVIALLAVFIVLLLLWGIQGNGSVLPWSPLNQEVWSIIMHRLVV